MSDARSTVRLPTSRLLPAVTAALKAAEGERWADVEAAIALEMSRPVRWWTRRFGTMPAATREEALARVKAKDTTFPYTSQWNDIWYRGSATRERLQALKDACELRQDHVDVVVDDVALFKGFYDADDGRVFR